jgi:2-hydroxychromene-2-carboxylate isomerase
VSRDARPRFYFSFRSPYSWLASHYVEASCDAEQTRLCYVPFWEPDAITLAGLRARGGEFLYTPMSRAKHLYILQDLRRLTAACGRRVTWPIDSDPWWDLPHLAYLVARRHGRAREFVRATYRARWEQGRDICARETIADLAEEIGMAPDLLVAAPEDPAIREEGVEALLDCHRNGVFGVPFFTCRREKFWGIDRAAAFVAALGDSAGVADRRGHRAPTPTPEAFCLTAGMPLIVADADHAGGCG